MAYPSPPHPLETVRFTLRLPTQKNGRLTALEAVGGSDGQRGSLWAYEEHWTSSDQEDGLQPCDTLHWLGLIAWQDRPNSRFMLDRCLRGLPVWEQGELPLGM